MRATKFTQILEMIFSAVNDYPVYNLLDTDEYFDGVKKRLKIDVITLPSLENYLKINRNSGYENAIWVNESLSALIEAFKFMVSNHVLFNDVLDYIKFLDDEA